MEVLCDGVERFLPWIDFEERGDLVRHPDNVAGFHGVIPSSAVSDYAFVLRVQRLKVSLGMQFGPNRLRAKSSSSDYRKASVQGYCLSWPCWRGS
jgi:hypothetical protein